MVQITHNSTSGRSEQSTRDYQQIILNLSYTGYVMLLAHNIKLSDYVILRPLMQQKTLTLAAKISKDNKISLSSIKYSVDKHPLVCPACSG